MAVLPRPSGSADKIWLGFQQPPHRRNVPLADGGNNSLSPLGHARRLRKVILQKL